MLSIIVAISENDAIGRKGQLLCHLPDDLRHFKQLTEGHTVVMGERTFLSLPKHPLPNRRNIVLTDVRGKTFAGAETTYSIPETLDLLHLTQKEDEETFIIGGGMVYHQFFPLADRLYITHIHHTWPDADTFFDAISPDTWRKTKEVFHPADEKHPYAFTFAEYQRKVVCTKESGKGKVEGES